MIRLFLAADRLGHAGCLIVGVLHRFDPHHGASGIIAGKRRTIAHRIDIGQRSAAELVDIDAVAARRAGHDQRADGGDDADPDDHRISRDDAAVGELDPADPALTDEAVDHHPGSQIDPMIAVLLLVERRKLGPGHARQHPRQRLEQGNIAAQLGQDRRRLKPDVAATDHDDVLHAAINLAHQLIAIGGPDQLAIRKRGSVRQAEHLRRRIDRGHLRGEPQRDGLVVPELRWADIEPVEGLLAGEVFLR